MSIIKFDEWIIDIDEEKTKELYVNIPSHNDSTYKNYLKVCRSLSNSEWNFFNKLYINPLCCKILREVIDNNSILFGGRYYIYGNLIGFPKEDVITADELKLRNFIYDFRDTALHIGRFSFKIQCPHYLIKDIPEDMPKGCICITFTCEQLL